MRQAATSRGDHYEKGRRLRFWAAGVALAAAGAGVALMVATGGPGKANASTVDPADLSLSKSDSPDPVVENALLTYTLEVDNAGPDPATTVVVSDDLPSQVDPISADPSVGNCEIQGKKVRCELGTLDSGASATVTIEVRAEEGRADHQHGLGGERCGGSAGRQQRGLREHHGDRGARGGDVQEEGGHDRGDRRR